MKQKLFIDGSVKEAKRGKRETRRSVRDAKVVRHAQGNLEDSNKKYPNLAPGLKKTAKIKTA